MCPVMCGFKKISIPTHRRLREILRPVVLVVVVVEGRGYQKGKIFKGKKEA